MAEPLGAQQWETFKSPTIPNGLSFLRTLESNVEAVVGVLANYTM